MNRFLRSFTFRLTLWYAVLFCVSAWVAFAGFYLLINSEIQKRTDAFLRKQVDEIARVYQLQGIAAAVGIARIQAEAAGEKRVFFRMFYRTGVVFASANLDQWSQVGMNRRATAVLWAGVSHYIETRRLKLPGSSRSVRVIYRRLGEDIVLQWGISQDGELQFLATFKRVFGVVMGILLGCAVAGGAFMARRAMARVERIGQTARRINENNLDARVPVGRRSDELDDLAVTINNMLDRIQALVASVRQMNDNIAHDLRSPIARIRGLAEVTLAQASAMDAGQWDRFETGRAANRSPGFEEFVQMAGSTIEECDRLLDIIATMLAISRTESGCESMQRQPVDLGALVTRAVELFEPVAEDSEIQLRLINPGNDFWVVGNGRMLQRMVANLLDNALKYTGRGGKVTVSLGRDDSCSSMICLTVADTGCGIEPRHLQHIFERFFRGDQSRGTEGAGLGLALALAVAKAHGGTIQVQSVPGKGSTFEVLLAAAPS